VANLKPQHYRLLAGPYRTAVWAVLARFKTEFVAYVMAHLAGLRAADRRNIAREALPLLRALLEQFRVDKATYHPLLARSIEKVDTDKAHGPDHAIRLADQRIDQLEGYLEALIEAWEALELDGKIEQALYAVAQLIWPYYCVVYQRRLRADNLRSGAGHNFCTWVADSAILENSCFPSTGFGAFRRSPSPGEERPKKLRLNPSLDECFEEVNQDFRGLLDTASLHLLDFEDVESNLGHVQELTEPDQVHLVLDDILRRMLDAVDDPAVPSQVEGGLKQASAAFTDLFQFTNQAHRHIITKGQVSGMPNATPLGVLFLASPSLDVVRSLLPRDVTLASAIESAWERAGGHAFTTTFYDDFDRLRRQFRDLDQGMRADAAGDVSHHSKNILNNVAALIKIAQRRRIDERKRHEILRMAEHSARYVGQEFGLHDRIRGVLREMETTRSVLAGLRHEQLGGMLRLQVKQLLTFRQGIDADLHRRYSLNGRPIDTEKEGIDWIALAMRDQLAEIYEERGRVEDIERAGRLRKEVNFGVDRDPLALTIFFICREMIDNVRPRLLTIEGTSLDIELTELESVVGEPWRRLNVVQRLDNFAGSAPFEGAATSESIKRFNERHGPNGTRLAQIFSEAPTYDVSRSQHIFPQALILPGLE